MPTKTMLYGGNFQDSMGNLLVNGYLTMKLSADEEVNDSLICSGIVIRIQLDSNGDVASSSSTPTAPDQYVWANDLMLPVNSYYQVTGFTANGQIAWGPNNQQVISNSSMIFDVGTWVPNYVISWTPPLQPLVVEVDGVASSSQSLINFTDSATVTFSNPSGGEIVATATGSGFVISDDNFFLSTDMFGPATATDALMTDAISYAGGCPAVAVNIQVPITIHKITINVTNATAGTFGYLAIYTLDGQTKLLDAGTNAFNTGSIGIVTVTLGSPYLLDAGVYLVAWNNSDGTKSVEAAGIVTSGSWSYDLVQLLTANAPRYVRGSNGVVAGNMPASLGTISVPNSGSTFDLPAFLFE
jgi:hypothetical protein